MKKETKFKKPKPLTLREFVLGEEKMTDCSFFALYAGLMLYKAYKSSQPKEEDAFSIAGAEAYCMLQDLKEQFPKEYEAAEEEFNIIYRGSTISVPIPHTT